jgi:hypothetical protein
MERAAYGCYSVVCLEEHVFYTGQAAADPARSSRQAHPAHVHTSRVANSPVPTDWCLSIAYVLYRGSGLHPVALCLTLAAERMNLLDAC